MKTKISIFFIICLFPFANSQVNFQWAKALGGSAGDYGYSISVDAAGNVYTTGTFLGTADFDPGPGNFTLASVPFGNEDIFVSKLDAFGNFVWAKHIGGTAADQSTSISVDAAGNVYVTGYFYNTTDFDPGTSTFTITPVGASDIFILKLDASGNFVWAKSMGNSGFDMGYSIAIDTGGNVYTTGEFYGTVDFDPGTGIFNVTSASGNPDIFVSKLNSAGNFVWAKAMGGIQDDHARSINIDKNCDVYTSGYFSGVADFDPGTGVFNLNAGVAGYGVFISRLDSAGNFIWAKQMAGNSNNYGQSLSLDTTGNIYTTGYFYNTTDFDPGSGVFNLVSAGFKDIFVSKLDISGNFVWAKRFGSKNSQDGAYSIKSDPTGNTYITGFFADTVDFDPGAGVFNLITSSWGNGDVFILKLDVAGNFVWAKALGGTSFDYGRGITTDATGNVYTTGEFDVSGDFDPDLPIYTLTSGGSIDAFVHKMGQTGLEVETMNKKHKAVCVFPNPNSGSFKLELPGEINATEIKIVNVLGQTIFSKDIAKGTNEINISDIESGVYLCLLLNVSNIVSSTKLIID